MSWGWSEDPGHCHQVPLFRITCDGQSISFCPQYQPQAMSHAQPDPDAPCPAWLLLVPLSTRK